MSKKYSDKRWHDNVFKGAKFSGEAKKLTEAQKKRSDDFFEAVSKADVGKNKEDKDK